MDSRGYYRFGLFSCVMAIAFVLQGTLMNERSGLPFLFVFAAFVFYGIGYFLEIRAKAEKLQKINLSKNENQIDWTEMYAIVTEKLGVEDSRLILQNATVLIEDIKPVGKQFDLRWNGYQKFLPLEAYRLYVAEQWRLYYSVEKKTAFLFVYDMVSTPFCFIEDTAEQYFS